MKRVFAGLLLLSSLSSFASTDLLGSYEGLSNDQRKCALDLSERRYGNDENSVDIKMKVTFAKKVFKKKTFEFSINRGVFNEDTEQGYIDAINIDENVWTDYYNTEDLGIKLGSNGKIDQVSVTVEDERWYRSKVTERGVCTNLVKKH